MKTSKILCTLCISIAAGITSFSLQAGPNKFDQLRAKSAQQAALQGKLGVAATRVGSIVDKKFREEAAQQVIDTAVSKKPGGKTEEAVVVEVVKALKDAKVPGENLTNIVTAHDSTKPLRRVELERTPGFDSVREHFARIPLPAAGAPVPAPKAAAARPESVLVADARKVDSREASAPEPAPVAAAEDVPPPPPPPVVGAAATAIKGGTKSFDDELARKVAARKAEIERKAAEDVPPSLPERPASGSEATAEGVPPPPAPVVPAAATARSPRDESTKKAAAAAQPKPASKVDMGGIAAAVIKSRSLRETGNLRRLVPGDTPEDPSVKKSGSDRKNRRETRRPLPQPPAKSTSAATVAAAVTPPPQKRPASDSMATTEGVTPPVVGAAATTTEERTRDFTDELKEAFTLGNPQARLRKISPTETAVPARTEKVVSSRDEVAKAITSGNPQDKLRPTGRLDAFLVLDSMSLKDRNQQVKGTTNENGLHQKLMNLMRVSEETTEDKPDDAEEWEDPDVPTTEEIAVSGPSPSVDQPTKPQEDTAQNITSLEGMLKNIIDPRNPIYESHRTGNIDKYQIQGVEDTVLNAFSEYYSKGNGQGEQAMESVLKIDWQNLLSFTSDKAIHSVIKYHTYYVLWSAFMNTLCDPLKQIKSVLSGYCTEVDGPTGERKFTKEGEEALSKILGKITEVDVSDGSGDLTFHELVSRIQDKTGLSKKDVRDGLIYMLYQEGSILKGEDQEKFQTYCKLVFNRSQLQRKFLERYGKEEYERCLKNTERLKDNPLDNLAERLIRDTPLNKADMDQILKIKPSKPLKKYVEVIVGPDANKEKISGDWVLSLIRFNIITDYRIRKLFVAYAEKYGATELEAVQRNSKNFEEANNKVTERRAAMGYDDDGDDDDSCPEDWYDD